MKRIVKSDKCEKLKLKWRKVKIVNIAVFEKYKEVLSIRKPEIYEIVSSLKYLPLNWYVTGLLSNNYVAYKTKNYIFFQVFSKVKFSSNFWWFFMYNFLLFCWAHNEQIVSSFHIFYIAFYTIIIIIIAVVKKKDIISVYLYLSFIAASSAISSDYLYRTSIRSKIIWGFFNI